MDFGVSPYLTVFVVAMTPVLELRVAIPLGISMGLSLMESLFFGVLGSLAPVPFILLLLDPVMRAVRRAPQLKRIWLWLDKTNRARAVSLKTYGALGLCIFVAVPIPSTGAWSGAILASFLGIRFWTAFLSIAAGTVIAGAIVTILSLAGSHLVGG
ncbi:MAG TPA: small multi-drug export protein [Clostridia bacterium]|nr:small multi-drug export protein [Clostridia bacterium]